MTIHYIPTITNPNGNIDFVVTEDFNYDPAGNRLTGPITNETYTYDQGNRLQNHSGYQYQYDSNGNVTTKVESPTENWTYTYDYENRLISAVRDEDGDIKTVTFRYDPFGRRIEKKIQAMYNGVADTSTYTYVYDNEDIITESLTEVWGTETETRYTRFIHGPGIDEPLGMERNGQLYYFHADGLGSITAITDSNQTKVESYAYSSFGEVKRYGYLIWNTFTYTGREWDEETGLLYYRARYYDPETGRFISKDPFPGFLTNPQTLNPYPYVGGNPVNWVDPEGKFAFAPLLYFAGAKVLAIGTAYLGVKLAQGIANVAAGNVCEQKVANQDINKAFKIIGVINAAEVGVVGAINAGIAAPAVTRAVLANPATIQNAADFAQGAFMQGPPPPSSGGYLGNTVAFIYDYVRARILSNK